MDLYIAPKGDGQLSTAVGFQLPDIFQGGSTNFIPKDFPDLALTSAQKRSHEVTKNLISIYKNKRMQIFHNIIKTRKSLCTKEFFRIYLSPTDATVNKKSLHARKYKTKFHKSFEKQKPLNYQMEYERLRGLKESEEELAKVQAYIDKMIARNMKKMEDEKKRRQMVQKPEACHYSTLQELVIFLLTSRALVDGRNLN